MNSSTTDFRKRVRGITVRSFAVALCGLAILCPSFVAAGTISTGLITAENSIVNTGKTLVSAANFGEAAVDINGLTHGAGSAAGANLTHNIAFEGDFRNNQSGLGGNLETLLSGIGGSSNVTMSIGGLTVGKDYLFQGYWEANNWGPGTQTLTVTMEGDNLSPVVSQAPAVLISYEFTAGDTTLDVFMDRNDGLGGDGNNWLSGYSLQEYAPPPPPGTITASVITGESSIVNTGGALVSAANFGEAAVDINGLVHGAGSAAGANLTENFSFEGDFRNNQSGLGGDMETLLSGIAGSSSVTMSIDGLTVGQHYLFQGYWEANNWGPGTQSLTVTMEGDTLSPVVSQAPAVLISYDFIAGDTTLDIFMDRNDGLGGDGNNWLSGYSLQEVPPVPEPSTFALAAFGLLGLGWCGRRRRRRAA